MKTKHPPEDLSKNLVIIPAYQPDESLLEFTEELLDTSVNVLVVNDGSSPDRDPVFYALSDAVTLLSYGENRGKGHAIKHAMKYVLASMEQIGHIVVADADGQHAVKDTLAVLDASRAHPDALVLGVRSFPENTPIRSRIGNRLTAKLFQWITKTKDLSDTQTGLRAFSREIIPEMVEVEGERYEYEMKQLVSWAKAGRPLVQVPIETIYRDKENSTSHYDTLRDSARIFRTLFDNGQAILFTASGIASFSMDFLLFNAFYFFLKPFSVAAPLIFANVAARFISSIFNFYINRTYVFESHDALKRDAFQYGVLVLALLVANNFLLTFFGNTLHIHPTLAKLCVEITLFIASYLVQHIYIFSNAHLGKKE